MAAKKQECMIIGAAPIEDVAVFREEVVREIVPIVCEMKKEQQKRLGRGL